jgi:DNA helicase-2/ATP-dependent DNA helicase PcrA
LIAAVADSDIEEVARLFDCTFDAADVAFLKTAQSCDVHACPGSGKTTLLVAKLAILARRWPWRDKGILVLSHTNVARQEIQRRLAGDPAGSRLLRYPHFVGTIQGFVDQFLAFPFLRDVGIDNKPVEEPRVDDDLFATRAWTRFVGRSWGEFKAARNYLKNKHRHDEGRSLVESLFYKGVDHALAAGGKVPSAGCASGKQLRALKDGLAAEGVFRFADMFAFANTSLVRHPFLRTGLRRRFPFVFVDEVQDTPDDQEALLNDLFAKGSIVQKLGDTNQAIFRGAGDGSNRFTSHNALDLPKSHRLAPNIAAFASRLTAVHRQQIEGNPKRRDRAHTIFLFDDETISMVLPAYGNLLLQEWPHPFPVPFLAKAVGFKRKATTSSQRPSRIGDYWSSFPAEADGDRPPGQKFIQTVRWARRLVETEREYYNAHRALLQGVAQIIEHQEGARVTRRLLMDRLRNEDLDDVAIRGAMASLVHLPIVTEQNWREATRAMIVLLFATAPASVRVREYLSWEAPAATQEAGVSPTNVYRHESGGREVEIVVATIHSVKGETHDATLVLETFDYEHGLATLLPDLCAEPRSKPLGKRALIHMKRAFVATTRARELVCLALHGGHVSHERVKALSSLGWNIQDLRTTPRPSGIG